MPVVAWRFQADIPPGVEDPDVTVFVTSTYTNDATGEVTVPQDISNPVVVKLSALPAFLAADPMILPEKPKVPVPDEPDDPS